MRLDTGKRKKKNCKENKYLKVKQPMNHWRTQRGSQQIPRNKWQWKHDNSKHVGCSTRSSKREVLRYTNLPEETIKVSNNLILYLKQLEKEKRTEPVVEGEKW